jgi:glycosyltransferase involved in cell wall biosynthesis/GT2 family glycosyltransferase
MTPHRLPRVDPSSARTRTVPLEVCIATCDIVGPIRNGGIGTAYYNLALALAQAGHRVTVAYALGTYCEQRTIGHWRRHYRELGIEFVPLPAQNIAGHSALRMSYGLSRWLEPRHFDVVHCHEWRGLPFYTALAKGQGLCLPRGLLCVGAHSPTLWHLEGMNELADAEALEVDFMERESVARADVLWSPSRHMIRWMGREGWRLPRRTLLKPYLLMDLQQAPAVTAPPSPELVFFGRLETRKGLDLFCDALDRLDAADVQPSQVTFLGKLASVDGVPSGEYLARRAERWRFPWQVLSDRDRDGAMAYLRAPGRVAVLPSRIDNLPYTVLECLGSNIPFVAAATGGIPEMIAPRDRNRVLFAFDRVALAERLAAVVRDGLRPARLLVGADRITDGWLEWHAGLTRGRPSSNLRQPAFARGARPARPLPGRRDRRARPPHAPVHTGNANRDRLPLVSVCITHRNRRDLLGVALESVRRQDYPRIEVVLVDDGSTDRASLQYLEALEPEFVARGWKIVRQANRYLGAARNTAVKASSGEFVLFMDDDNLAKRDEITTFVRAAQSSGADILTCFLEVFQSRTAVPRGRPMHIWPFLGGAIAPGILRNVFGDANALFRRSVLERLGGFTEDFGVGCEDWELFARAVLSGARLEVVPRPLVRYRTSPTGMLRSTSQHANRMRALRPYLGLLPPHLRPLVHLAHQQPAPGQPTPPAPVPPARLDHVQRAVVFGAGEAGRLAIGLARRCGWEVPWITDNNPAAWDKTAHGRPVRSPDAIKADAPDLVIVASLAGKPAISAQLEKMGLSAGTDFVHFLDPVRVGGTTLQLSLP